MKAVKAFLFIETVCVIFAVICVLEFKFMGESIAYEPPGVSDETPGTVITAKVRLDGQTLKIQERIYLKEPESELYLNIPAGIYAESKISGIYPSCRADMLNGSLAVKICFDSETDVLGIDYELNVKQDNKILAHRGEKVYLTQFLITPAVVIDDKPVLSVHSEFGDPFVYDIQDYEIEITADKSYEIIAPGR
ncbi:MAG: M1 family metallopeptidase, partial [Clostridiales bacterium]|nr:M1 family metallopeptidase [Clostridiales bacterium]